MIQIFSVFPGLFFLTPFSATLLRIVAAYAFLYMANSMVQTREKIANLRDIPLVGSMSPWMIWVSATITAIVGALLAIGLYTQVAAILGLIISLKHCLGMYWYPSIMPLSRGTYALLFVICISLLITGAGQIAFDLPL